MASRKIYRLVDNIIKKSWKLQELIEDKSRGFGKGEYGRVIKMARKPDYEEFMKTCAIVGAGIGIIGGLGFLIYYLWVHLPDWFGGLLGI